MKHISDERYVAKILGNAAMSCIGLVMFLLWGFLNLTEGGSIEERYILVTMVILAAIFAIVMAAHLLIQMKYREAEHRRMNFILDQTFDEALLGSLYDDEQRGEKKYTTESN